MNEDLKRCLKNDIEKELSEFNFRKDTQKNRNQCRGCIKLISEEYKTKNKDKIKIRRKEYSEKTKHLKRMYDIDYRERNREKIRNYKKHYMRKRKESDLNFKLICNIRTRTNKAFISQNIKKTNKTIDLLGCSPELFRRWIVHQLYGDMTEENYGSIWTLDHCYPLSKTNLSDKNEMNKSTYWIKRRPMFSTENNLKGCKIDYHLYLLQEVKAKYFLKLNNDQQGFN